MRWPVFALVALGACVDVPAFAPPGSIVLDGYTVSGEGFSLHFASGDAFHYPDSFVVGGRQLLGTTETADCASEDGFGMAMYPAPRVSGGETAPSSDDTAIDPTLRGPAIGKVRLTWHAPFTCTGAQTRNPTGYSSFTIFPDGKIVRYDSLQETGATPVTAASCQCPGVTSSNFFVTSFWSFARGAFDTVGLAAPTALTTLQSEYLNPATQTSNCLETNAPNALAVRTTWLGTPVRTRVMPVNAAVVAMVRDLQAQAMTLGDLVPTLQTSSSIVSFHPGKTCSDTEAVDARFGTASQTVFIDGAPVPLGRDGIYGGETATNDGGFGVSKRKIVMTGGVQDPFAVMIGWPSDIERIRVTAASGSKSGTWYIPQIFTGSYSVIWFRDGIGTDTFTIEAE